MPEATRTRRSAAALDQASRDLLVRAVNDPAAAAGLPAGSALDALFPDALSRRAASIFARTRRIRLRTYPRPIPSWSRSSRVLSRPLAHEGGALCGLRVAFKRQLDLWSAIVA